MSSRRPWFKFYPADWQGDEKLRVCSGAARNLWLECMCIMHRADPYGHLVVNERPVTDSQLAVLAGIPPDQVPALLAELATAGVSSRNRAGVLYSRRMTRDEKRRKDGETAKITGSKVPGSRRSQVVENTTNNSTTTMVVGMVASQPPTRVRTQSPESSIERDKSLSHPKPSRKGRLGDRLSASEQQAFDEWWQHYPVKVGKPEAQRAFRDALRNASLPELIAGADRYAEHLSRPDAPKPKYPQGWLAAERWNDELAGSNGHDVSERQRPQGPAPALPEGWEHNLLDIKPFRN